MKFLSKLVQTIDNARYVAELAKKRAALDARRAEARTRPGTSAEIDSLLNMRYHGQPVYSPRDFEIGPRLDELNQGRPRDHDFYDAGLPRERVDYVLKKFYDDKTPLLELFTPEEIEKVQAYCSAQREKVKEMVKKGWTRLPLTRWQANQVYCNIWAQREAA